MEWHRCIQEYKWGQFTLFVFKSSRRSFKQKGSQNIQQFTKQQSWQISFFAVFYVNCSQWKYFTMVAIISALYKILQKDRKKASALMTHWVIKALLFLGKPWNRILPNVQQMDRYVSAEKGESEWELMKNCSTTGVCLIMHVRSKAVQAINSKCCFLPFSYIQM